MATDESIPQPQNGSKSIDELQTMTEKIVIENTAVPSVDDNDGDRSSKDHHYDDDEEDMEDLVQEALASRLVLVAKCRIDRLKGYGPKAIPYIRRIGREFGSRRVANYARQAILDLKKQHDIG